MPNRPEVQNKGQGRHKDSLGRSAGPGTSHKGVARTIRINKRAEAEERNNSEYTVPEVRRAFWRERGFNNMSHARRAIRQTVVECNDQAEANRQRSADWPLLPEGLLNVAS